MRPKYFTAEWVWHKCEPRASHARARVQLSPMFWQFGYHTCLPGARRGCAGAARSPAAATASMSTRAGCCPLAWRCNLDYVSMQLCLLAKDGHVKRLNLSLSQRGHQSQEETDAHVGRVRNRRRPRDACSMHPGATCRWRLLHLPGRAGIPGASTYCLKVCPDISKQIFTFWIHGLKKTWFLRAIL